MSRRTKLILALASAISLGGYLLFSHSYLRIGFPLDDAWIHQTYARNLAQLGEWSFLPGQPSGGSTGPMWGVLLSLGHALGLGPYGWTFVLGWLILTALGVFGNWIFQYLSPQHIKWSIFGGLLLVLEWHLVWAAGSGMETLLFALLATVVLGCLVVIHQRFIRTGDLPSAQFWLRLGALIGMSVWLRPDGITLLAPVGLLILLFGFHWRKLISTIFLTGLGFLSLFAPYLIFNQRLAGSWWPTTFFAKQAEYSFLYQIPLLERWFDQALLPLVGAGALLLPGFVKTLTDALRRKYWGVLLACIWVVGYTVLYAWRLPVTYQHGRYIIPMMPLYFLLGFAGLVQVVQPQSGKLLVRVLSKAWIATTATVLVAFWWIGARAYARDVAVIESEMVAIAHWVNENTSPDAIIATHDIGALGYFSDRTLLDLAGLISPEVIPFLWDGDQLGAYLNAQGADYLVTFPGWYPTMTAPLTPIFQTDSSYSRDLGGENMAIYLWKNP